MYFIYISRKEHNYYYYYYYYYRENYGGDDADEDANAENDYDINKDETGDEEPVIKNP